LILNLLGGIVVTVTKYQINRQFEGKMLELNSRKHLKGENDMPKSEFKNYIKTVGQPMRPYVVGEDLTGISVWEGDVLEEGGMIAQNPKDASDMWYVAKQFFRDNYIPS